jgi:hypothetical protein
MSSEKKLAANRRNAKKSTGPKTKTGKRNAKMNALKEGIFCRQLSLGDQERPEYELLRADLLEQLRPTSAMQLLVFDGVVASACRCSNAIRRETRLLTTEVLADVPESAPPMQFTTEWYGANPHAAHRAMGLLECAIEEVRSGDKVLDETAAELEKAFGAKFMQQVNHFQTADYTLMQMITSFRRKAEIYGTSDPKESLAPLPEVTLDPRQQLDTQERLLDVQRSHLSEVQHMLKNAGQRPHLQPELGYRYVTAAFKLFMALVTFYDSLPPKARRSFS